MLVDFDGFVSYKHSFLFHKIFIDGLVSCGLLWCFYLLSFWWHPFTAEDSLLSEWIDTFFPYLGCLRLSTFWVNLYFWVKYPFKLSLIWHILISDFSSPSYIELICLEWKQKKYVAYQNYLFPAECMKMQKQPSRRCSDTQGNLTVRMYDWILKEEWWGMMLSSLKNDAKAP